MGKNDRTVRGRAPNAGRNLHEQSTKIIKRPSANTVRLDAPPKRRATPEEVADALTKFRESRAADKWRASTAPTVKKEKPRP
jgi:hypothetical protein